MAIAPNPDAFTPVPAFPAPVWQSLSPGEWIATHAIVTIGTVHLVRGAFKALSIDARPLGIFASLEAAQSEVFRLWRQHGAGVTNVRLWLPDTPAAILLGQIRSRWSSSVPFFRRGR